MPDLRDGEGGGAQGRHSDQEFGPTCGGGPPRSGKNERGGGEESENESGRGQKYGHLADQRDVVGDESKLATGCKDSKCGPREYEGLNL